jgi:NodT family efflux transporter outer membrane factor (OMF) lipoprotein
MIDCLMRLAVSSAARSASVRWLLAIVLTAPLGTVGCKTNCREYVRNGFKVGPNYCKPEAEVADRWIDYEDPRVISQPQSNWAWWRVFNDPVLDQLVQTAARQNLTLRQAGFRIMEARALRNFTTGNLFPQSQTAFGSYSRQLLSQEVGFQAGGGGGGGGFSIPREFSIWNLGTQFAWELDFWGRFRRAIEAADAQLDASVEDYDDVLVILIGDIGATYVEIRTLEQRIRYARQNVKNQTGSLELAETQFEGGAATRLDVTQAETNVAQTESAIPQFETQLRQAENRLCVLLGIPPQDLRTLLDTGARIPKAPAEVAVGIPADLVRRRPDVRRAERLVAVQSAEIGIAESDLYPAFTINGQIFVRASQFEDLFKSTATGGNVGPSFNWNIFNYGRIRALIEVEEAQFMQQVAAYQQTVLDANREAEDAIVAFLNAQEQVRILQRGARAAEESRDLVEQLYRGGRADFGRVFVAELFLVQQQDALAVAEGEVARSLVEIYRSLGGGWQIRLGQMPPMTAELQQPSDIEELPPVEPPAASEDEATPVPELGG